MKPLISFSPACVRGTLIARHKRFTIEFTDDEGCVHYAHTNNSGSMLGLVRPGLELLLSPASNPARKLPYTLELIRLPGSFAASSSTWVGVNTSIPNKLLKAAFEAGKLPWAKGYTHFQPEVRFGDSRFDGLLSAPGLPDLWVECKNVTMVEDGVAAFPDAVSVRAQKHVTEMRLLLKQGARAAFFYCVQRDDASCFAPAAYIDPAYAEQFTLSLKAGVEAYAHHIPVCPEGIGIGPLLPLAPESYYA